METAGFILSIFAILGSLGTYLYHDKKIKTQEARINDYEISKFENEKVEALKAKIRASYKEKQGLLTIKISNKGLAIARNIRLEFNPDEYGDFIRMDQFPYPYLNPGDSTEVFMHLHTGMPDTIEIIMKWEDDFNTNNKYSKILTI